METFELVATSREDVGKGASRRLRRDGRVPGIVYGADEDPQMISLDHNEIMHHLDHEAFYSHILTLKVDDKSSKVVLKDLQRHPYKRLLLHIDLLRINEKEELTMRVPLHFINEEKCIGVKKDGGAISHMMTDLEIVCLPKDLPEYIEVDMLEVELDQTVHLSELKLPEGVQIYSILHGGEDSLPVAAVHMPRIAEVEEPAEEVEAAEVPTAKEAEAKDSEGDSE